MPKETRSVAAPEQGSSGPALSTAFCAFCKEFVLASDHSLDTLPRRPVDQSLCLRNRDVGDKKRVIYNMSIRTDKQPVVVRRPEGRLEKLYRTRCTRCDLQVGYEVTDPQLVRERGERMRFDYSYVLAGALTEQQNTLPPDAFSERVGWYARHDQEEAKEARAEDEARN